MVAIEDAAPINQVVVDIAHHALVLGEGQRVGRSIGDHASRTLIEAARIFAHVWTSVEE
ncbi:MAG: hypothetical protein ACJ72W_25640 [Actinoallomurus sp.]